MNIDEIVVCSKPELIAAVQSLVGQGPARITIPGRRWSLTFYKHLSEDRAKVIVAQINLKPARAFRSAE